VVRETVGRRPIAAAAQAMALPVDDVRRFATAAGLEEIYYNEQSRVISFAPAEVDTAVDLSRINVYYTTGTVGTCINHPRQGRTQLFRRNVPLETLPELFRDPRIHTGTGYHRRVRQRRDTCAVCLDRESQVTLRPCGHDQLCMGCADQLPRRDGRLTCPICRAECIYAPVQGNPLAEEYEAEAALAQLRVEEAELQTRIQDVQGVINAAQERRAAEARRQEQERQRAAAAAAAADEARRIEQQRQQERERQAQLQRERAGRGTQKKYALHPNARETIDKSFGSATVSVALNESDGAFVIQEGGGYAFSAGMPDALYNLLQQEKNKRRNKRSPAYVALGSEDRYYIRFTDGSSQWSAVDGDNFSESVRAGSSKGGIRSVAFGKPGCWFIVYENGGWSNLSGSPGLNNKIEARGKRADLKCVSLGPNGEWYLAAENGRAWWGGYSNDSFLESQIKNINNRITFMDFGGNDTFIVRFE